MLNMLSYEIMGQAICVIFFFSSIVSGFLAYVHFKEDEGYLIVGIFSSIFCVISIFITNTSYKNPKIVGGLIVELIKSLI